MKTTKVTENIGTPSYHFFCETKWRRYGTHRNGWSCFVWIFSTTIPVPNRFYCYSKTLNRSVVCIGLFISLRGDQQELVCLIISCSKFGVIWRWYLIHSIFFWSKRWGYLGGSVLHWGSYYLKQGNLLNFFKITHNYLFFIIIFVLSLSSF